MPTYLLTGAGFSRNWGGWLANEVFEYLLTCAENDDELRDYLWETKDKGLGFEAALWMLQNAYTMEWSATTESRLRNFTSSLYRMFAAMNKGFAQRTFEDHGFRDPRYKNFLGRFDAIFTLNQDLLLEGYYLDDSKHRRTHCRRPGLVPVSETLTTGSVDSSIPLYKPVPAPYSLDENFQPYIKLHGSIDWLQDDQGLLLIMGGRKAHSIAESPLLAWYQEVFRKLLTQARVRLMIIGYSFGDDHINAILTEAVKTGAKLFIVDPRGVDVMKQGSGETKYDNRYYNDLKHGVVGASRRLLKETFGEDATEFNKLGHFIDVGDHYDIMNQF